MGKRVQLLDCTLRDGAYIVDAKFGVPAIRGIIKKLQDADVDIIECGWLKNTPHEEGTSFYHVPEDLEQYVQKRREDTTYVGTDMICNIFRREMENHWMRFGLYFHMENTGKVLR